MSLNNQEGHRKRLREKFIRSGISGFHDYEIVELLLTIGTPRRDCKHQAKEAMRKFKTLRGVLEAPIEELREIKGIGPHNVFGIKLVQEVAREFLKERILQKLFAGNVMQIRVLDHIIIGDNKYFSFADEGLIEEYNLNFLSLKRRKNV